MRGAPGAPPAARFLLTITIEKEEGHDVNLFNYN